MIKKNSVVDQRNLSQIYRWSSRRKRQNDILDLFVWRLETSSGYISSFLILDLDSALWHLGKKTLHRKRKLNGCSQSLTSCTYSVNQFIGKRHLIYFDKRSGVTVHWKTGSITRWSYLIRSHPQIRGLGLNCLRKQAISNRPSFEKNGWLFVRNSAFLHFSIYR